MTEHDFWLLIRQGLLTLVDAVEKNKLGFGQPDPITKQVKPTTGDLRKEWKRAR